MNKVDEAKAAARRQYAIDHDRFADLAVQFQKDNRVTESMGARAYAARIFRAWQAEEKDPEPDPPLLGEVDR